MHKVPVRRQSSSVFDSLGRYSKGKAVYNISGGPVHGLSFQGSYAYLESSEAELQQNLRYICNFTGRTGNEWHEARPHG